MSRVKYERDEAKQRLDLVTGTVKTVKKLSDGAYGEVSLIGYRAKTMKVPVLFEISHRNFLSGRTYTSCRKKCRYGDTDCTWGAKVAALRNEASVLKEIRHVNIVSKCLRLYRVIIFNAVAYDFVESNIDGAYHVLILEYMPCGDLKRVIDPRGGRS